MTEFHVALFAVDGSQLVVEHGSEGFGPLRGPQFSDGFICLSFDVGSIRGSVHESTVFTLVHESTWDPHFCCRVFIFAFFLVAQNIFRTTKIQ